MGATSHPIKVLEPNVARVIVVDGPEKAGKTTLCMALCDVLKAEYVHWGPVKSDLEYGAALVEAFQAPQVVVWDRSWASESVYGALLGRDRRLAYDHWLGEWLYGLPVRTWGMRVMLWKKRAAPTPDDLPVEPEAEEKAFFTYAKYFNWHCLNPVSLEEQVGFLLSKFYETDHGDERYMPPAWVGPRTADVVFVGEKRNDPFNDSPYPGPFSSLYTSRMARVIAMDAFKCGWTNADEIPDWKMVDGKLVIACGGAARNAVRLYEKSGGVPAKVIEVPHPAWLYRWERGLRISRAVENDLKIVIGDVLKNGRSS